MTDRPARMTATSAAPDPRNASRDTPTTGQFVMARPTHAPKRARILIVDDMPVARRTLGALLDPIVDVAHAASIAEAEELLTHPWDAIVVDVVLPDGSGLEWAERARALRPSIEILVITGSDDPDIEARVTARGMFFATKPRGFPLARRLAEVCAERTRLRAEAANEPDRRAHRTGERPILRPVEEPRPTGRARLLVVEGDTLGALDLRRVLAPHAFRRVSGDRAARAAHEMLVFDAIVLEAGSLGDLSFLRELRDARDGTPVLVVASDGLEEIAGVGQTLEVSAVGLRGLEAALVAFARRMGAPLDAGELHSAATRFGRLYGLTERQIEAIVAWVPTRDYDDASRRIFVTAKSVENQIATVVQRTALSRTEIHTQILMRVRRM